MNKKDKESLIKAAHQGGKILKKYFSRSLNPTEKTGPGDLQTEADLESEKIIVKILKSSFPYFNIYSEELGFLDQKSDYTFYIDPLDGTNNFVLGIPNFSVSIGLAYKNDLLAGVIYQPILNQTFFAEKNNGAYLNNKKIQVSKIQDLSKITISNCFSYTTETSQKIDTLSKLISSHPKRITWNWSVAYDLCMFASGKTEALVSHKLEIHDYAAGKLIAREAGAIITDLNGKAETNYKNDTFIVANNTQTSRHMVDILKSKTKGLL